MTLITWNHTKEDVLAAVEDGIEVYDIHPEELWIALARVINVRVAQRKAAAFKTIQVGDGSTEHDIQVTIGTEIIPIKGN